MSPRIISFLGRGDYRQPRQEFLSDDITRITIEFERQDHFLLKAGLLEELEAIVSESRTEAEKLKLRTSNREMILPDGMAASYQVLVQKKRP